MNKNEAPEEYDGYERRRDEEPPPRKSLGWCDYLGQPCPDKGCICGTEEESSASSGSNHAGAHSVGCVCEQCSAERAAAGQL